jgi:hypothetical protein
MKKEEFDLHTASLEMAGGYHGHPYPQKFVKAKSEHPYPCNYEAEKVNHKEAMNVTLGHK